VSGKKNGMHHLMGAGVLSKCKHLSVKEKDFILRKENELQG